MNEEISEEEGFEHALSSLTGALQILAMSPEDQCETMGNYNVAWEIQDDVAGHIPYIVVASASYLTERQVDELTRLASALKALPEGAIVVEGLPTTSHAGSIAAMRHPAWEPLRIQASEVLMVLESAIQRNAAYFA